MADVPSRLYRRGRPPDPVFLPAERLFRRVSGSHIVDDQLVEAAIPFPDLSVNRERYSLPEDVILNHPGWGIFSFRVEEIPASIDGPDARVFTFRIEHVPRDENYSHSEVWTYLAGQRTAKEPPKTVRVRFRLKLRTAAVLLKRPEFAS